MPSAPGLPRATDDAELRDWIRRRATRAGLAPPESVVGSLADYVGLLRRWNARMNLTALDGSPRGLDRLLMEPLQAAAHLPSGRVCVIDIGSGAGSPALPLALAAPAVRLRMVESRGRRAAFLREACRRLAIAGAEVLTARYEALLPRADLRGTHDVLTVRAVRIDPRVLEDLQTFVRPGGELWCFRGTHEPDWAARPPRTLALRYTLPLVAGLGSRLVVFEKRRAGAV